MISDFFASRLNRTALIKFTVLALVVTIPTVLLVNMGVKNESSLIFFVHVILGLPWNLLYLVLPFNIPGFTSAGVPNANGDLVATMSDAFLFLIPIYVNIFIISKSKPAQKSSGN